MILEAEIDNIQDAEHLVKLGANRLEVCSNLQEDGCTPTPELFQQCKQLNVMCFAMIRPIPGSFVVSKDTAKIMFEQIDYFKQLGAEGLVLGALTEEGTVDANLTSLYVLQE